MDLSIWKKRKKELKLKYEDISALSGIPLTTVKNVFCGYVKTPRIDTVQAIEKALGIDGVTPEEYAAGARMTAMRQITADEDIVLDKYQEIKELLGKEKGQAYVESLLDSIIENFRK